MKTARAGDPTRKRAPELTEFGITRLWGADRTGGGSASPRTT